jgi:homoserine dehydrogenase
MERVVVRVGVIGAGNVGSALVAMLLDESRFPALIEAVGAPLRLVAVAVRDTNKPHPGVPAELLTSDALSVATRDDVDLLVELAGGVDDAYRYVRAALESGKSVVTANKALIAAKGTELEAIARAKNVDLIFEAAVGGGIPILRALRTSLVGEKIHRVMGIMNGTTNYILTRMTEAGAQYGEALAEAQALGYAEADPTADVEGLDAAAKIAIVASIAFGVDVTDSMVDAEGISSITADDIAFATRNGFVIKLLAVAERFDTENGHELIAAVHPVLVPASHPLASVRESFNAVFVEGEAVGELMFYGRGAGGDPTASAVLGDLIDAAVNLRAGAHGSIGSLGTPRMRPSDQTSSAHYLSLVAVDRPGVLATIASVLGDHGVSIASMAQSAADSELGGSLAEDEARLDFITHRVGRRELDATLAALRSLEAVRRLGSVIRVLIEEEPES